MKPNSLTSRLRQDNPPYILDVRSAFEFRSGRIPGAVHVPFWKIPFSKHLYPKDPDQTIVVTCEHGPRAVMACVLLRMSGYRNCALLEGHMSAWRRLGLPVEKG